MNDILANLVVCGLLGMTGQGIRAVLGISNAAPSAAQAATQQSVFNASYLVVSLIVGFIAGVLAGLGLGLIGGTVCPGPQPCVTVDPKTLLGLIAAGYAGTDFIENTVAKMLPNLTGVSGGQNPSAQAIGPNPRGGAPSPAPPGADKGPAAPAAAIPDNAAGAKPAPAMLADIDLAGALRNVLPSADQARWLPALTGAFQKYGLTTPLRISAAIGQFVAEAGNGLTEITENLNYSADRLRQIFPSEVPDEATAQSYANKPEAIANLVYAHKNGNGDAASGDGWKFRGRGLIQITGRAEYQELASALKMDLDHAADYVATSEGAAVSACWYLNTNRCLPLADEWRLTDITRIVNGGGMQALDVRVDYANRFRHFFNAPLPAGQAIS